MLVEEIRALFARESLPVVKKGKNGPTEQDIIPMIRKIDVQLVDVHTVCIDALVCCQNPSLNPTQLVHAVETYLPCRRPDHAFSKRNEIYSVKENVFR